MKFAPGYIFVLLILVGCSTLKPPKQPKAAKFPKFTEKDTLLGTLNENRKCFDVTYYDLDLKIDPANKTVDGSVKIHFHADLPVRKMQIDLAENMVIDSILDNNGQKLEFTRKHRAVTIKMKNYIMIGGDSHIKVMYHGKPQKAKRPPWKGGLVWKKKKGKWLCGVACEDDGASIWWPCKDHIKDKPDSVQARYTIPEGYMCVANGRLLAHEKLFNGFERFTWRTSYPIQTYNVSFYIGDFEHFQIPYSNENSKLKELDFYVLKENVSKAKSHFTQAVKILKVYEELFGSYPWWKDGYKLVESPYEGMEHQTAIAYGAGYKNEKYIDYDYIILHETAHEWWGNHVTACDMSDLWIHEGFATYAEMLYEEKVYGTETYDLSYNINRNMSRNRRPLVGPRGVCYTNFNDSDIYYKGAVVLHMLRRIVGDKVFFLVLKKFSNEYADHCVYTEHFIKLLNDETGNDYGWFFDQFVFRAEAPELNYWVKDNQLKYQWNQEVTNENFELPIYLIHGKESELIFPNKEVQTLQITSDEVDFGREDYVIFTKKKF